MFALKKSVFGLAAFSALALSGCGGNDGSDCYYDMGASAEVDSMRVFYPCDLPNTSGTYNATTLSGGFTNSKENMYWLANTLVDEGGMVVFALTAASNLTVPAYTDAQLDAFDRMVAENNNSGSVLYRRMDKLGLMGYSMGGGAVLNAGNELGNEVDTVVAIAPYNPENNLNGMTADTLLIVGENDAIAPASFAEDAYDDLPNTIDKVLLELDSFNHTKWMNNNDDDNYTQVAKQMILSFLDYELNGNESGRNDLINTPAEIVVNENNL